ncbi:glycerol-3-phosphate 1-O-acyltransferase PlsY [Marinilactibacillus psychrotolerans]|uniref:Glycerol-3-phosphate acyltransferase n=1 Tax=Marinilactibacillus psychrotolerans TaxID=191770 RepID=A0A511GYV2_9LACT|nr:glycerol-3-phosphate 1-O-acyltransferase PlsY [Marinilactibacillus psychrotolerans]TLQ06780.1 glycerol-3-phosphate 1-O-acyltransferase PlsY [Marinilactibacillus psychrotolerans]GEL66344.1 glycerol-3-phosphate acyltransferase [Marinilactibacillus psychrotolerans]GEQ34912.1 glycerol-3-phosphate acyltransferase [Marinilactibacillus psychrotolerans]SDC20838.1 glycerol-3-phosphate acyltransferase PlsY [Marinilactibacillus psychrotolerans]
MLEAIMFLLAYLLGSIPSGVWIGKLFYKTDVREHGSGNSGTTNTFRVLGKKAGIIVLVLDILKGTLAALLPMWLGSDVHPMVVGLFAVIGHVYPIFAKFKGGKAVATSAGIALGAQPIFLLCLAVLWGAVLYTSSMVSLASIIAVIIGAIASLFLGDPLFALIVWVAMIIVIVRHKSNIGRIKNGTENKVPFGFKKNK